MTRAEFRTTPWEIGQVVELNNGKVYKILDYNIKKIHTHLLLFSDRYTDVFCASPSLVKRKVCIEPIKLKDLEQKIKYLYIHSRYGHSSGALRSVSLKQYMQHDPEIRNHFIVRKNNVKNELNKNIFDNIKPGDVFISRIGWKFKFEDIYLGNDRLEYVFNFIDFPQFFHTVDNYGESDTPYESIFDIIKKYAPSSGSTIEVHYVDENDKTNEDNNT